MTLAIHVKFDIQGREQQGPERKPRWHDDIIYSEDPMSLEEVERHVMKVHRGKERYPQDISVEKIEVLP